MQEVWCMKEEVEVEERKRVSMQLLIPPCPTLNNIMMYVPWFSVGRPLLLQGPSGIWHCADPPA